MFTTTGAKVPFPVTQSGRRCAEQKGTGTTYTFADAIVEDEGLGLRRAGAAVICLSGAVALLGLTALTLAYETWSGYVIQAVAALVLGLFGVAVGWSILREGDRLGPRLRTFPRLGRPTQFTPEPPPTGARVWVRCEPIGALPPVGRTHRG